MEKIKKLKLPLWAEIVYFALIAIGPAVITALELFQSHSSVFKITFTSLGALLLTIIVIRRFVLLNKISKIKEKILLLEHDYQSGSGDKESQKVLWGRYNLIIYIYNVIVFVLALVLAVLFITALSEQLIQFKGASILILCFVLVALVFKSILYVSIAIVPKDKNEEKEEGSETK